MKCTVVWLKSVHVELGEIWLAATDRKAITVASDEIDHQLQHDADRKGKPLSEGLHTLDVLPLRAVFLSTWIIVSSKSAAFVCFE